MCDNATKAYFLIMCRTIYLKCKSYSLELLNVFIVSYRIAMGMREMVSTKGKC